MIRKRTLRLACDRILLIHTPRPLSLSRRSFGLSGLFAQVIDAPHFTELDLNPPFWLWTGVAGEQQVQGASLALAPLPVQAFKECLNNIDAARMAIDLFAIAELLTIPTPMLAHPEIFVARIFNEAPSHLLVKFLERTISNTFSEDEILVFSVNSHLEFYLSAVIAAFIKARTPTQFIVLMETAKFGRAGLPMHSLAKCSPAFLKLYDAIVPRDGSLKVEPACVVFSSHQEITVIQSSVAYASKTHGFFQNSVGLKLPFSAPDISTCDIAADSDVGDRYHNDSQKSGKVYFCSEQNAALSLAGRASSETWAFVYTSQFGLQEVLCDAVKKGCKRFLVVPESLAKAVICIREIGSSIDQLKDYGCPIEVIIRPDPLSPVPAIYVETLLEEMRSLLVDSGGIVRFFLDDDWLHLATRVADFNRNGRIHTFLNEGAFDSDEIFSAFNVWIYRNASRVLKPNIWPLLLECERSSGGEPSVLRLLSGDEIFSPLRLLR